MLILVPPLCGSCSPPKHSQPHPESPALGDALVPCPCQCLPSALSTGQLRTPLGEAPAPNQCLQARSWGPVPHPAWGMMLQT